MRGQRIIPWRCKQGPVGTFKEMDDFWAIFQYLGPFLDFSSFDLLDDA